MTEFLARLRFLLSRKPHSDVEEELRFHIEQSAQEKVDAGMTQEEARRRTLIELVEWSGRGKSAMNSGRDG